MIPARPPDTGLAETTGAGVRVASIPYSAPYVDAVLPDAVTRVGQDAGPCPWLDPAHLTVHAADVDVVHLHAGDEPLGAIDPEAWTEHLQRLGIPLVVTVHQLPARGQPPGDRRDAGLRALLATAEVVLTLTPGAAEDIADRYGRTAIVVAHPSIAVPHPDLGAERGLVGVRVGPAFPDPEDLVRPALCGAVSGGGRLRVLVEEADVPALDPAIVGLAEEGRLELVGFSATGWTQQLQQLHVAVLPQRSGTHSPDVEICRDVGTRVVAPSCGWFADQWSEVVTYGHDEQSGLDAVSLTAAVGASLARPIPRPADRAWRAEQQAAVRRVHAEVYAQVATDRSWT